MKEIGNLTAGTRLSFATIGQQQLFVQNNHTLMGNIGLRRNSLYLYRKS